MMAGKMFRRRLSRAVSHSSEARVQRGIEALKSTLGNDWPLKINVRELFLIDGHHCVLAQLFGSFSQGLGAMNGDVAWAVQHGFAAANGEWGEVQRLWENYITGWRLGYQEEVERSFRS